MTGHIYDMSGQEARIFANIIGALSSGNLNFDVREEVFPDILKLLRADVLASFEWNRRSNSYGNASSSIRIPKTWLATTSGSSTEIR